MSPVGTGSFVGATTTFSPAVSPRLVCFNDVYDVSDGLAAGYFIIDARSLSGESLSGYREPEEFTINGHKIGHEASDLSDAQP